MQYLSVIGGSLYALVYVLRFLIVLTVIVFFHELGHFLVARWCGVTVKVFSIGFGKEIFGFTDRKGTRWRLSSIPLGGFVRFLGDENEASATNREALSSLKPEERQHAFAAKGVAARAAIVAAGPMANMILAVVILTALALIYGRQLVMPRIDAIEPGSRAALAGFVPGDIVKSINGREIDSFGDVELLVATSVGQTLDFVVDRNGDRRTLAVQPESSTLVAFGQKHDVGKIGISGPGRPARVALVEPGSPAAEAGFQVGDRIETIDGTTVATFDELQTSIRAAPGRTLDFGVLRGNEHLALKATPKPAPAPDKPDTTIGRLGVTGDYDPADIRNVSYGVLGALQTGFEESWLIVDRTAAYVAGVFAGRESAGQLGGPIQVAQIVQQAASVSLQYLIHVVAVLSVSVGLINLLPIPMLDGGHLLFFLAEAIRGRPLSERIQDIGFRIGFAAILMLMIFAFRNDIIRLNWF